MQCYGKVDLASDVHYHFRSVIAFTPSAGIFYRSQERRDAMVGSMNTWNALEMSSLWLPSNGYEFWPWD